MTVGAHVPGLVSGIGTSSSTVSTVHVLGSNLVMVSRRPQMKPSYSTKQPRETCQFVFICISLKK